MDKNRTHAVSNYDGMIYAHTCVAQTQKTKSKHNNDGERMSSFRMIYADIEPPSRARTIYMFLHNRSDAESKCRA